MILQAINDHMNGGQCPTGGSLGECAAIQRRISHGDLAFYEAFLFLWPAAADLKPAEVASWFGAIGCGDVTVSAVLHDEGNATADGYTEDGARPWVVSFSLKEADRERLGMRTTIEDIYSGLDQVRTDMITRARAARAIARKAYKRGDTRKRDKYNAVARCWEMARDDVGPLVTELYSHTSNEFQEQDIPF